MRPRELAALVCTAAAAALIIVPGCGGPEWKPVAGPAVFPVAPPPEPHDRGEHGRGAHGPGTQPAAPVPQPESVATGPMPLASASASASASGSAGKKAPAAPKAPGTKAKK